MTFSWNSPAATTTFNTTTTTTHSGTEELPFAISNSNSCQQDSGGPAAAAAEDLAALRHLTTMLSSSSSRPQGSSRFKGVVPQPNGRWGAQIYDRHARVWLGTFPDEAAAARAYDVAAVRFRRRAAAAVNFPAAERAFAAAELEFLAAHSRPEVVDMLRKHTYADELRQGLRRGRGMGARAQPTPAWARALLFEKAVTPSDVGRLNRLVVPKQHAEKHFPLRQPEAEGTGKGVLLHFEDGEGKVWRFRYSYWNSSRSYVLTKGWSGFVREKGLRAGDTVAFSRSVYGEEKQLLIDCRKTAKKKEDEGMAAEEAIVADDDDDVGVEADRVIKLFGVDIAVRR